jgi:hypothetical protein
MAASKDQDRQAKLAATASNLRVDAATAEILRDFDAAGVKSVLLKGASLIGWLYPKAEAWSYLDCDLLVRPADLHDAERTLTELGFTKHLDEREMPAWWREHASDWLRRVDGVIIDLHCALPGVEVDAEAAWLLLAETTDTVIVARYPAPILALPARALHVVLHAAQHGADSGKSLRHLERALALTEESTWLQATALAARLGASEAFAAGLSLTGPGEDLRDRLGLGRRTSVDVALRARTAPPIALGLEQFARATGTRARLHILIRKLFPPAAFMRHWDRSARDNRRALAWAYARRPFWLLRNAPRGVRTWRSARREARESQLRS